MKPYLFLIALLTMLAGCDQAPTGEVTPAQKSANILRLSDATEVLLRGTHQKSHKKPNSAGFMSMHEFVYAGVDKIAENDVYAVLKNNGYTRKIILNDARQFKVQYYKKSLPPIGAIFVTRTKDDGHETLASIYWQEK
ncbi:MAG: hypothetical protein ACN6OP_15700 [Pseudomonadales bacterium]|uniref:hypothetical protein n=1 Tax=Pseudomonas putida TaxID=303 RepID=UPI0021F854CC|nr:hypothetical protein [Pseudomonas putida]